MEFTLVADENATNLIMALLAKQPFEQVVNIVIPLQNQINEQVKAMQGQHQLNEAPLSGEVLPPEA